MSKVDENSIRFTINTMLDEYDADLNDVLSEVAEECAKETAQDLKAVASNPKTGKPWKKYSKAWTADEQTVARGLRSWVVHLKKPYYRIGHLLEFGHAKRDGGRVDGYPHIEPIEQKAATKFEQSVKEKANRI